MRKARQQRLGTNLSRISKNFNFMSEVRKQVTNQGERTLQSRMRNEVAQEDKAAEVLNDFSLK